MKKIGLYLESGPACGGSYQYNRFLLKALADIYPDKAHLIAFVAADHWLDVVKRYGISAIPVQPSKYWRWAQGIWRRSKMPLSWWHIIAKLGHPLARQIRRANCDLVIFPSQDALTYLMPVPTIGVIHDLMHRYERQFPEVGAKKEYEKREFHYRHLCQHSRAILVDSELGKQQAENSYHEAKNKCHVLPFITSVESHQYTDIQKKYDLPKQYFFYPAQFWAHKNHVRLLKALHGALKTHPDMQLVLVGSPKNAYDTVLNTIRDLNLDNHVKIFGLVPDQDMPGFFHYARALVMPTFFGPTNIPPLEAFALKCPVAVSGIYAMPERYQDAAVYFDPNSVQSIQEVMVRLWEDDALCHELILQGEKRHQNWHYPQFKQQLSDILSQIN